MQAATSYRQFQASMRSDTCAHCEGILYLHELCVFFFFVFVFFKDKQTSKRGGPEANIHKVGLGQKHGLVRVAIHRRMRSDEVML